MSGGMDNDNRGTDYAPRERAKDRSADVEREAAALIVAAKTLPPEHAAASQWLLGRAAGIRYALGRGLE